MSRFSDRKGEGSKHFDWEPDACEQANRIMYCKGDESDLLDEIFGKE